MRDPSDKEPSPPPARRRKFRLPPSHAGADAPDHLPEPRRLGAQHAGDDSSSTIIGRVIAALSAIAAAAGGMLSSPAARNHLDDAAGVFRRGANIGDEAILASRLDDMADLRPYVDDLEGVPGALGRRGIRRVPASGRLSGTGGATGQEATAQRYLDEADAALTVAERRHLETVFYQRYHPSTYRYFVDANGSLVRRIEIPLPRDWPVIRLSSDDVTYPLLRPGTHVYGHAAVRQRTAQRAAESATAKLIRDVVREELVKANPTAPLHELEDALVKSLEKAASLKVGKNKPRFAVDVQKMQLSVRLPETKYVEFKDVSINLKPHVKRLALTMGSIFAARGGVDRGDVDWVLDLVFGVEPQDQEAATTSADTTGVDSSTVVTRPP